MTGSIGLDLDTIRADVKTVTREWGTSADCDWPPDIAAARLAEAVPALLAEVERLRAEIKRLRNVTP